jgi:hypothetical protein
MGAFRSGPRPSGEEARKENEAKKSKIEKILKEDNMEMAPGGPKKTIESKTKIGKGKKIIKKDPDSPKTNSPMAPEKTQPLAKGGRAGFKAGSKGCKLAMKGKGRAYGKNS